MEMQPGRERTDVPSAEESLAAFVAGWRVLVQELREITRLLRELAERMEEVERSGSGGTVTNNAAMPNEDMAPRQTVEWWGGDRS